MALQIDYKFYNKYWKRYSYSTVSRTTHLFPFLKKYVNKQYATMMCDEIQARADKGNLTREDDSRFYRIKNTDFIGSIALTIGFDRDLFDKASTWIKNHAEYVGNTILEVGCENGVFSCFLAGLFPQAQITAIDLCEEAIVNACRLARELNLKNIKFECKALKDVKDSFDTVVSLRSMHENLKMFNIDFYMNSSTIAKLYAENLMDYSTHIREVLNSNGTVLSFERASDEFQLGWMWALNDSGIVVKDAERWKICEVGSTSDFFSVVGSVSDSIDKTETYILFNRLVGTEAEYNSNAAQHEGLEARLMFENSVVSVVKAYRVDSNEGSFGFYCVFHSVDPTACLMYEAGYTDMGRLYKVSNMELDYEEATLLNLEWHLEECRKNGLKVTEVKYPEEDILPESLRNRVIHFHGGGYR